MLPADTEQNQQVLPLTLRTLPCLSLKASGIDTVKTVLSRTDYRRDLPFQTQAYYYLHSNSRNLNADEKGFIITLFEIETIL